MAFLGRASDAFASPEGEAPSHACFRSRARRALPIARASSFLRRHVLQTAFRGAGLFASCPFAFALRFGLGPAFPRVDERCPGDLGLSVGRIPAALFATHTGILAARRSACPCGHVSRLRVRSPTRHCCRRGFGSVLEPRISSAQDVSASELLRTLLMVAASEPTSWLSSMPYILFHLARHLGPWPAVWAVSLLSMGLITRALTPRAWPRGIRGLTGVGRLYAPLPDQCPTATWFP